MKPLTPTKDDQFKDDVLSIEGLVLVDFWAPWCGPCRQFTPTLEMIAGSYEDELTVFSVNVDEEANLSKEYAIASIPTVLYFKDGEIVHRSVGAQNYSAMERTVEGLLS